MTADQALLLLLLLQVKHFLADWAWQSDWMVRNKGTWGHPGGIAHAGMHALFSLIILIFAGPALWLLVALVVGEFVIHYHLDWLKAAHSKRTGNTPQDGSFWVWMGADQLGHQVTYLAMVFCLVQFA